MNAQPVNTDNRMIGGVSRRRFLGLFAPAVGSLLIVQLGVLDAEGRRRRKRKRECHGLTTALEVVNGLAAQGIPIGESINYTAETDPNELLGRPGGYTSKVTFRDTRLSPEYDTIETTDGGSVEFFSSKEDLRSRVAYLEAIWATIPLLSRDVVFTKGTGLLRVSIRLLTAESNAYGVALQGLPICP